MIKQQFSLPLYPDLDPDYMENDLLPFLQTNKELIYDIYFTSRIPPFDQDAMGTVFSDDDLGTLIGNALVLQEETGIPISAVFNNKFISPNKQNMEMFIKYFSFLYDQGVRSATIPFTSWLMFGEIQKAFPELYIKNTVLWALDRPREVYDAFKAGFDYVNVDRNMLRDQKGLKEIHEARLKAQDDFGKEFKLSILYNESCVGNCPIQEEHYLYNTNNTKEKQPIFFKSDMNKISCVQWEKEDKSYLLKKSNVVYDENFMEGLKYIDVFKLHGRENRMVFENSLGIIEHYRLDKQLFDDFHRFWESKGIDKSRWNEWIETIKDCQFNCWKCDLCDRLLDGK
jgi:hypothetical protein